LQECVRAGQRVEAFTLEAWTEGAWQPIAQATTIGYKRLLRFEPVTAQRVRVNITQSRWCPTLAQVGLYDSRG
jgi:alpha-L-fucosidase